LERGRRSVGKLQRCLRRRRRRSCAWLNFIPESVFFLTLSVVVFTGGLPSVGGGSVDEERGEENWGERGRGGRRRRRRDGIRRH
jgi:hypothetical protein